MSYTWGTIRDNLERELGIEDELWINESELLEYTNRAVREAKAEIEALYQDYFLSYATITFVADQESYDLPSDIYANKIRRFLFENGSTRYTIDRMRDWKKFESKSIEDYQNGSSRYAYFIINQSVDTTKILVSPAIRSADAGAYGKLYYSRDVTEFTTSSDILDIPEFVNFIYYHVREAVLKKEGHPNLPDAQAKLNEERERMNGVLAEMVPDADNEIEADYSHYEEMI